MTIFHVDIVQLARTIGYAGLFAVIFAESGVFGFFLPGWSLLFTAGILASQGIFNVYYLIFILGLAAILGDNVGYWIGAKTGDKVFSKEKSLLFNKKYLDKTQDYYAQYGSFTVVVGRFVPIVRTFAPVLAGVGKMDYKKFLMFNILGGLIWAVGGALLGYFLGEMVPNIDKYITPIVIVIVILSILPIISKFRKEKKI